MDEGLGVDIFDTGDELICQEKHSLQGEFAVAEVEEVLQAGTQKVDDHSVVVTFGTEPADKWDSNTTSEGFVNSSFILELGVLGLDALELDGDFLPRDDVGTEIDVTKATASDLTADAVFITDSQIHCRHLDCRF